MRDHRWAHPWLRRIAGVAWALAWFGLLWLVVTPWRDLGGLVSERLRWLEWCSVLLGLLVGSTLGGIARDLTAEGARTYAGVLRGLLYPAALTATGTLLVLTWNGRHDPVGVVFTGLLAYWAGLDLGFGILPLLQGRQPGHPPNPPPDPAADDCWTPPWDRF